MACHLNLSLIFASYSHRHLGWCVILTKQSGPCHLKETHNEWIFCVFYKIFVVQWHKLSREIMLCLEPLVLGWVCMGCCEVSGETVTGTRTMQCYIVTLNGWIILTKTCGGVKNHQNNLNNSLHDDRHIVNMIMNMKK